MSEQQKSDLEMLREIEAVWSAVTPGKWRVEDTGQGYTKLYAVAAPNMHDWYLMDLSAFDANGGANVAAIAKAPEHIEWLVEKDRERQRSYEDSLLEMEPRREWTTCKPTRPGWYWLDDGENAPALQRVILSPLNKETLLVAGAGKAVDRFVGRWFGPLEAPR